MPPSRGPIRSALREYTAFSCSAVSAPTQEKRVPPRDVDFVEEEKEETGAQAHVEENLPLAFLPALCYAPSIR